LVSRSSTRRPSRKSSRKIGSILIGTSGWSYAHWRKIFYPESMPSTRWLSYYVRYFETVEINNSFYNLPEVSTFAKWKADVPESFIFAVKANRFITHMKKLRNVKEALDTFLKRVVVLRRNLGPILFQLPPNLKFDPSRLDDFLAMLPRRRRYAVEFRHPSWVNDKALEILSRRKAAFCIHDLLDIACPDYVTCSFAYFRFHGFNEKYGGTYPKRILTQCAQRMVAFVRDGIDVYVYFNNDAFGYAIKDAITLRKIVGAMLST